MSQTNTNIINGQNQNQILGRGGRGQGGPSGSGRGDCHKGRDNNLITKYSFERKMKDSLTSKLTITKSGHRSSQFKKIVTFFLYCAQIKTFEASMRASGPDVT